MGTVSEWLRVLLQGAFFGGIMFWISRPIEESDQRKIHALSVLTHVTGGLQFGFLSVFAMRALRWPLVAVLVPLEAVFILVASRYRKKLSEFENSGSAPLQLP